MNTDIQLSLVVPMFNEALVLDAFFARVEAALRDTDIDYEIVCINDGSDDDTLARLIEHRQRDARIKVINLSRNFGPGAAICAGLVLCRGQTVIPIDADLQDPPELIPRLLERSHEGFDVVYAVRRNRAGEGWMKRATSSLFWHLYNRVATVPMPSNVGHFRLMSRRAVDAFNQLPEKQRFIQALMSFPGFPASQIEYDREPRAAGTTKWNWGKLWNHALDGLTAFSTLPLRVWTYIGVGISATAFAYAMVLIFRKLAFGNLLPGYASLMVVVLFLGGVQLITLGVLGEYIGRIFHEVKARPTYVIESTHGFDDAV